MAENAEECKEIYNPGDVHMIICNLIKGHTGDHKAQISWENYIK